jgi:hypothetical protein
MEGVFKSLDHRDRELRGKATANAEVAEVAEVARR